MVSSSVHILITIDASRVLISISKPTIDNFSNMCNLISINASIKISLSVDIRTSDNVNIDIQIFLVLVFALV